MKKEHEKKVYKIVLDLIHKRKRIKPNHVRFPDEEERNKEAVDVLAEYAGGRIVIEHTVIESYIGQRDDYSRIIKLLKPLEKTLENELPKPGHYSLTINVGATKGAKNTDSIRNNLIVWIKATAPLLKIGSPRTAPDHYRQEKPQGVPFEVTLYRFEGNNGKFFIMLNCPKDVETQKKARLEIAFKRKCPKLAKAKQDKDISILLLEMNDISLGNIASVAQDVQDILPKQSNIPDEIYLIRTELEKWEVWVLKEGDNLFEDVMEAGPHYYDHTKVFYEADKSCAGGQSEQRQDIDI
jgi:hypothetical protein